MPPAPLRGRDGVGCGLVTLLSPGERPAFEIVNPDASAPFILLCDHASNRVPKSLGDLGVPKKYFNLHVAWDIGAFDAAKHLARRFDATLVHTSYSRLVIDCNRRPESPGLCPPISDGVEVPANKDLPAAERRRRLDLLHRPYHDAIEALIAARRADGQVPAIVSIHSCTPVMAGFHRPWHLGILWNADERIAKPLIRTLSENADLCIGDNQPYTGKTQSGYTIPFHAERNRLPHVMVEIRQDLIGTKAEAERWAGTLGDALAPILAEKSLYRPSG
ncbi:MAG: N-formylglutamate amidohydrolase [Alphaproteobacteria bacterium]|nr:N-formylglutamate amidohydrolase [Alphaproteobacteria bacterium]